MELSVVLRLRGLTHWLSIVSFYLLAALTLLPSSGADCTSTRVATRFGCTEDDFTRCPIVILTEIDSSTSHVGQVVEAALLNSLQMNETYNAPPGSMVLGHVTEIEAERTQANAILSAKRMLNTDSCMSIVFDEIVGLDQQRFIIDARLAKQGKTVSLANGNVRTISVNSSGQLVHGKEALHLQTRVLNIVGQNAIGIATIPAGSASLLVTPIALGAAGAVSPSFISNDPVNPNAPHRRLTGLRDGIISGIPGAPLVQAFIVHGDKTVLLPGDEVLMSCRPFVNSFPFVRSVRCKVYGIHHGANDQQN